MARSTWLMVVIVAVFAAFQAPATSIGKNDEPSQQLQWAISQAASDRDHNLIAALCSVRNIVADATQSSGSDQECGSSLGSLLKSARVVVATVPDPRHTELALFYDRALAAVQEAAQDRGYDFVSSWTPWDNVTLAAPTSLTAIQMDDAVRTAQEKSAGFLLFRNKVTQTPLLILIVGERPTTGPNQEQLNDALALWKQSGETNTLLTVGSTFSGSLPVLTSALQRSCHDTCDSSLISGTVNSADVINKLQIGIQFHFFSFQQKDTVLIERTLTFLREHGIPPPQVALLSEDETAYGSGRSVSDVPKLYFPRGIGQLRSAFQKDVLNREAQDTLQAPRRGLRLELGEERSQDDTLRQMSQFTPASQDAVMQGLIVSLKAHHTRAVVLRATDVIDQLFLSEYLKLQAPDLTVVVIGTDTLFFHEAREHSLSGMLFVSTYSLLPFETHSLGPEDDHVDRLFPNAYSVGIYRAATAILERLNAKHTLLPQLPSPSISVLGPYGVWQATDRRDPHDSKEPASHVTLTWAIVLLCNLLLLSTLLSLMAYGGYSYLVRSRLEFHEALHAGCAVWAWVMWGCIGLLLIIEQIGFPYLIASWKWSAFFEASAVLILLACSRLASVARAKFVLLFLIGVLLVEAVLLLPKRLLPTNELYATLPLFALATLVFCRPQMSKLRQRLPCIAACFCFLNVEAAALILGLTVISLIGEFLGTLHSHPAILPDGGAAIYRFVHLTSGVSIFVPLLTLIVALFWACRSQMAARVLFGHFRPQVPRFVLLHDGDVAHRFAAIGAPGRRRAIGRQPPRTASLKRVRKQDKGSALNSMIRTSAQLFRRIASPTLLIASLVFLSLLTDCAPDTVFDPPLLEWIVRGLFAFVLAFFAMGLWQSYRGWQRFEMLLNALENTRLRRGFSEIHGYPWSPVWSFGNASITDVQRGVSRQMESLMALDALDRAPVPGLQTDIDKLRKEWNRLRSMPWRAGNSISDVPKGIHHLSVRMSFVAAKIFSFLDSFWSSEGRSYVSGPDAQMGPESHCDDSLPPPVIAEAERFICLSYLMLILALFQRLRSQIGSLIALFLLMMLAVNSYPFSNQATLRMLIWGMFLALSLNILVLNAKIHRNPTLSRITNTKKGELGSDFWLRNLTLLGGPILAVIASHFPSVANVLFGWLEPILRAGRG